VVVIRARNRLGTPLRRRTISTIWRVAVLVAVAAPVGALLQHAVRPASMNEVFALNGQRTAVTSMTMARACR
jgi:hypothetical protein